MSISTTGGGNYTSIVTRANAKLALRVDSADQDDYIDMLIEAAGKTAETYTRKQLWNATHTLRMEGFGDPKYRKPGTDRINLPLPPVQSISSIQYVDINGDTQTWNATNYQVDTSAVVAQVMPAYNGSYPPVRNNTFNSVTITYVSGYGTNQTNIPTTIRNGITRLVDAWYCAREDVVEGNISTLPLPLTVQALFGQEAVEVVV